jgi:hypothetical protein
VLLWWPQVFHVYRWYIFLEEFAQVDVCGYFCVGVASIRFAALAVNKTFPSFRSSTTIRCVLAGLSCLIWAQIVIGLLVAHISTTAFAVYPQL